MMLELHGKRDVKKLWFLSDLKNIFQFFSLHKQGYFCFRIVSKGRIFQNIFFENANSNCSRRAWVACDNSTLKIRKICFSPNNGAFSVSKLQSYLRVSENIVIGQSSSKCPSLRVRTEKEAK